MIPVHIIIGTMIQKNYRGNVENKEQEGSVRNNN